MPEVCRTFPRVKRVRHLGEYRLELGFTDGTTSELDFEERVVGRGGVFAPLENIAFFQQVQVDPEAGTVVWPNGVDFCPDVLYHWITGKPIRAQHKAGKRVPRTHTRPPRQGLVAERGG